MPRECLIFRPPSLLLYNTAEFGRNAGEASLTDEEDIIRQGRACVCLIEANDVLIEKERRQYDHAVLEEARQLVKQRLRQLVKDSDPAVMAQIMAASDKRPGTVAVKITDMLGEEVLSTAAV